MVQALRFLFDTVVKVAGGFTTSALAITSFFCTIAGLLAMANENRVAFKRTSRFMGVIIAIFGLLLPFRHVSIIATILSLWWTVLLFNAVKKYEFYQSMANIILSLSFWIYHSSKAHSSLMQTVGDFLVFLILPSIFIIVYLSRGYDRLSVQSEGPVIPLKSLFKKLNELLNKIFPPSQ